MKKSPLIFLVSLLLLIGAFFISVSSLSEASSTLGDKFFFLRKHFFWLTAALVLFVITTKIKIENIKKISFPLYIFSLIILVLVFIPGLGNQALGARRWLNLGFISIQPSEILKLTSVIYFSYLFSQEKNRNIKTLVFSLLFPFLLIILEPNLSTALLISLIAISIYFLSGGNITSLISLLSIIGVLSFILILVSPYRLNRLKALMNIKNNTETTSYHSNQIILTIASGGLFGKGFANSDQKYRFLPKISTDSILAVIGEETGLVGISLIILIYSLLISYLLKISKKIFSTNVFQSLVVSGVACWIAFQSLINMAAIAAIIPLTGVPLPFISYGGSSLLTLAVAIGLIRNIEKNHSLLIYSNNEQSKRNSSNKKNHHHWHSSHSGNRINSSASKRHQN